MLHYDHQPVANCVSLMYGAGYVVHSGFMRPKMQLEKRWDWWEWTKTVELQPVKPKEWAERCEKKTKKQNTFKTYK